MSLKEKFDDYLEQEIADINFEQMYERVKEQNEYECQAIRRMITLLIYHSESQNKHEEVPVLMFYLKTFTKDKLKDKILSENLLYIISKCQEIADKKKSDAHKNLYM